MKMCLDTMFILLTCFVSVKPQEVNFNDYLLDYKEGIVTSQNFTYYYIYHWSNILIILRSKSGDADIYISDSNMFPTYDVKSYDIHSATCGQEVIQIHEGFKSPIAVGIYGYFPYGNSSYILEVYREPKKYSHAIIDDMVPSEVEGGIRNAEQGPLPKPLKKKYKDTIKTNSVFALLEVLQLMFL
ncbi:unnamed protein product [Acanthoscelides obtectus]|uniref:Uncharacterized protein n=1 Tax=Acanthoscelides obtectus TaxID=200917 RepID=A0A9P0MHV2_ACAOB|nr:unnamed protein product [Acanthoscelides obtectus]CAK1629286.1 hypothetical protein AOBTE_LOCUS5656 [Acanthoscelides obtectus]